MSEDRHPGITMHKLPVGGGFVGILFALGSAAIFLVGLPSLWCFVVLSAGLGIAIAALFSYFRQTRSDRNKPLSILAVKETAPNVRKVKARDNGNLFHVVPGPIGA